MCWPYMIIFSHIHIGFNVFPVRRLTERVCEDKGKRERYCMSELKCIWEPLCLRSCWLISQEKSSLQVYSNKETWPLSAATVIYVKTTDHCGRQPHTLWHCAQNALTAGLVCDSEWHNLNRYSMCLIYALYMWKITLFIYFNLKGLVSQSRIYIYRVKCIYCWEIPPSLIQ